MWVHSRHVVLQPPCGIPGRDVEWSTSAQVLQSVPVSHQLTGRDTRRSRVEDEYTPPWSTEFTLIRGQSNEQVDDWRSNARIYEVMDMHASSTNTE